MLGFPLPKMVNGSKPRREQGVALFFFFPVARAYQDAVKRLCLSSSNRSRARLQGIVDRLNVADGDGN